MVWQVKGKASIHPLQSETFNLPYLTLCLLTSGSAYSSLTPDANARELLKRAMYMERILKHKFEGIALDTSSLCRMAEDTVENGADDDHHANSSPREDDDLGIEEEVCTIDPVEDTITRTLPFLWYLLRC